MQYLFFLLLGSVTLAVAGTIIYDFEFTWINAAPDGFMRPVIAINGQFPGPTIYCTIGDRVIINTVNNLRNTSATIHFHGLYQNGSTSQDGADAVSQCPIPIGQKQTYDFTVDQPGTYWYHSHFEGQYPDGLRAPFIVHDPESPYKDNYTEEIILTLSDWYHDQMPNLLSYYLNSTLNVEGSEPYPYSALINDAQNVSIKVKPGTTYFLRVINIACFAPLYLQFEQHTMTIIEMDGVYTQPQEVDVLYLATAQRYGVLLTTKNCGACCAERNYAALAMMDTGVFDQYGTPDFPYAEVNLNVSGWLVYDDEMPLPPPLNTTLDEFHTLAIDDFIIQPYDQIPLYKDPDQTFVLDISFFTQDGQNRAGLNDITWIPQMVPSLFTTMTTGKYAVENTTYGLNANAMVLAHNEIIEVVINNFDNGIHPFHIHGHAPQIVARSTTNATYIPPDRGSRMNRAPGVSNPNGEMPPYNTLGYNKDQSLMPKVPMRRDTWMIAPLGYTVIRFIADNPGVWFMHCHMDWHLAAGLAVTFIEAPLTLQQTQSIPEAVNELGESQGIPIAGNAAGNTQNLTDLDGANTVCPPLPEYTGWLPNYSEEPPESSG